MKNTLAIFEGRKIRRHYDEKTEVWFFSVIDIIAVLTDQTDYLTAKTYWTTLKNRLKNEGSEVVTECDRLKMIALDGKMRLTDVANAAAGKSGGNIARKARLEFEAKTGKKVVSKGNYLDPDRKKRLKK